jgi:hypothetical protein
LKAGYTKRGNNIIKHGNYTGLHQSPQIISAGVSPHSPVQAKEKEDNDLAGQEKRQQVQYLGAVHRLQDKVKPQQIRTYEGHNENDEVGCQDEVKSSVVELGKHGCGSCCGDADCYLEEIFLSLKLIRKK